MIKIQTFTSTHDYNPELPLLPQFENAVHVIIDSESSLVDDFLEKLQKANFFQLLKPFDIELIPHGTIKSMQLERKIQTIMRDMDLCWLSKTIIHGQQQVDFKIEKVKEVLNKCLAG